MPEIDFVFDLDGTISDPKIGMAESINWALNSHNFKTISDDDIGNLIGLPLDEMYARFCGDLKKPILDDLVDKYRQHFWNIGYSKNTLYPEVKSLLRYLYSEPDYRLFICTSKPADIARKILNMFNLDELFDFISGGDVGIAKHQQLKDLLNNGTVRHNPIMIGDRFIDIQAARQNQLQSIGVLWGYGSRSELEDEGANYVVENPGEIKKIVALNQN
ncbi:MAG: HAD family hydrolase [Acidiferrobacteraceae bacterium]|nr:HAD family hydrolase [Acidiferrobacteraceae bacterium]